MSGPTVIPVADAVTSSRKHWRARWLAVHLWLGLTMGLVFVLLGLTGSALVFYQQLDGWLNPEVVVARQPLVEHSYQDIFAAIKVAHPERTRGWRLEVPAGDNRAYTARYYYAAEKQHKSFAPLMVTVNPYTLEVRASRFWGETAMTFIYDLHYILLVDGVGSTLVAVAGLIVLISLFTGMYLWWPHLAALRHAFTWKRCASAARRNYDMHKLSGVYGSVLLLVLTGTGVMLAKPEWFNAGLQQLAPVFQTPRTSSSAANDRSAITLDQAALAALRRFPVAQVRWIETPDGDAGVYRVRMQQPDEPSQRFPQTYVWLDQFSSQVLAVRDAQRNSASDSILAWLHPLHNGEAFGLFGRWIAFVAGLLPLLMYATGFIRWRQKRRARRVLARRQECIVR